MSYGAARHWLHSKDAMVTDRDMDGGKHERPLLYSERVGHMLFEGCMGIFLWPVMMCEDIPRLERHVRGLPQPLSQASSLVIVTGMFFGYTYPHEARVKTP